MGDPTNRFATANIILRITWPRKPQIYVKGGIPAGVEINTVWLKYATTDGDFMGLLELLQRCRRNVKLWDPCLAEKRIQRLWQTACPVTSMSGVRSHAQLLIYLGNLLFQQYFLVLIISCIIVTFLNLLVKIIFVKHHWTNYGFLIVVCWGQHLKRRQSNCEQNGRS
jgi:hypothetical protein